MIRKLLIICFAAVMLSGCEKLEVKRDFYPNGKLMVEKFTRGPIEVNKVYHVNGKLAGEYKYKNGVRHGVSKYYSNETGRLVKVVQYKNGEEVSSKILNIGSSQW